MVPELGHLLGQALQEPDPELGPGLLAAAEADDALDLVPALEESLDVAALGGVVVLIDLGRNWISLSWVFAWLRRASRAFMADSYLNLP